MASDDSLFSFEVAVECLRITVATVACRFPAVAFRLLDFPSLLIPHLDENERRHFKATFLFDYHGEIPLKFKDLLDSRGNFQFNKGKSCMFKFDLEKLYDHLHNVPLYVIIIDLWGNTPKLVGVSTIPLADIVTDIWQDVQEKGISFPSMHGRKDTFPVYNLMGSQVGKVDLGYRMLSLGMSLLPHLPSSSILQKQDEADPDNRTSIEHYDLSLPRKEEIQSDSKKLNEVQNFENSPDNLIVGEASSRKVANQAKPSLTLRENGPKHRGNTVALAKPYSEEMSATSHTSVDTQTQTTHHRKIKSERNKGWEEKEDETGGIVVTNTHCPPPLYFNAKWDSHNDREPERPHKLSNRQTLPVQVQYSSSYSESLSESSDSYHSRTMQVQYSFKGETPERIRKVVKDSVHKKAVQQTAVASGVPKRERRESGTSLDKIKLDSLPILTALLQELSVLTGSVSNLHEDGGMGDMPRREKENKAPPTSGNTKEDGHSFLTEKPDLVPSHSAGHRSCRHKLCAKPPEKVPSAKGWLRQEPVFQKKETKLQYKMTYSQKLRLKKNNPKLLKILEAEEKSRKPELNFAENNQSKMRKTTKKKRTLGATKRFSEHAHLQQPKDVPTEIERHFYRKTEKNGTSFPSRQDDGPSTSTPTSRPPVPTPRRSLITGEAIPGHPDGVYGGTEDFSNSEKSARSIEVFIPNPSLVDSDGQSRQHSESDNSDNDHFEDTKESFDDHEEAEQGEVNDPGFPTESFAAVDDLHVTDKASSRSSYSQDFESAQEGSERYSDNFDDSPSYHTPREEEEEEGDEEGDSFKTEEKSESFSPQMSRNSRDSLLESDESKNSRISGRESYHSEDEGRISDDVTDVKFSAEGEKFRNDLVREGSVPKVLPKKLAIPKPLLSATSPVPQQRNPPSKIVMVKPVSVADMEFNESVEVNLPSDLSESFDVSQSRPTSTPLETSEDMPRSGKNQWHQRLDVIRSESEKKSGDEYSEDFVSELDDTDDDDKVDD